MDERKKRKPNVTNAYTATYHARGGGRGLQVTSLVGVGRSNSEYPASYEHDSEAAATAAAATAATKHIHGRTSPKVKRLLNIKQQQRQLHVAALANSYS